MKDSIDWYMLATIFVLMAFTVVTWAGIIEGAVWLVHALSR